MTNTIKPMIGKVFNDIADAIETGQFGERIKVGITTVGSELGIDNIVKGAELAQKRDKSLELVLIGPKVESDLSQVVVENEDDASTKMEELLDSGEIQACVTMHYNFPIGVSTVGKAITPAKGKETFVATTTGTSSADRIEAMILNGINGIITAKAMGIEEPTLGILNLDGSRQVERAFRELIDRGYPLKFAESQRIDGGHLMRGNDLLAGVPDIMITDTLTGNILMKMLSSYTSGGNYESIGYGYGPGIGEGYDRIILILSRTSGVPVVANAISYGADLIRGDIGSIIKNEYELASKHGLKDILERNKSDKKASKADEDEVTSPPEEIVTETISGIDILELDDAIRSLWKAGVYAESGMGCTGPVVMVNEKRIEESKDLLCKAGYAVEGRNIC
ncbi:MAG TPA: glycine/sarcosine/betaine reductase complex component C subunit alpha [Tissierellaceae bacterium]|nr:glycine/sarcosine/betaine reductase complex component C subunit alpha [Tissierellaceae bacterium]